MKYFLLTISLLFFLTSAALAAGSLKISSEIENIEIFIDDSWAGNTILSIPNMPPGRHGLSLKKEEQIVWQGAFNIIENGQTSVKITKNLKIEVKESPVSEESIKGRFGLGLGSGWGLEFNYGLTPNTLASFRIFQVINIGTGYGLNINYYYYRQDRSQLYFSGGANYLNTSSGTNMGGSLLSGGEYLFLNNAAVFLEGGYRINRISDSTDLSGINILGGIRYYF